MTRPRKPTAQEYSQETVRQLLAHLATAADEARQLDDVFPPFEAMKNIAQVISIMARSPLVPESDQEWQDMCTSLIENTHMRYSLSWAIDQAMDIPQQIPVMNVQAPIQNSDGE